MVATPPTTLFLSQQSYSIIVTATEDDENGDLSGSLAVYVTVTDVEEEGTVAITPPRGWVDPQTQFSADLIDDDGSETNVSWQWSRSPKGRSSWEEHRRRNVEHNTATSDDAGHYLRATPSYEDRRGNNKDASAVLTGRIEDARPTSSRILLRLPALSRMAQSRPVRRRARQGHRYRPGRCPHLLTQRDGLRYVRHRCGHRAAADESRPRPRSRPSRAEYGSVHDGFDATYSPSDVTDDSIVVTIKVTAPSPPTSAVSETGT